MTAERAYELLADKRAKGPVKRTARKLLPRRRRPEDRREAGAGQEDGGEEDLVNPLVIAATMAQRGMLTTEPAAPPRRSTDIARDLGMSPLVGEVRQAALGHRSGSP